jgi:hypothetical protein
MGGIAWSGMEAWDAMVNGNGSGNGAMVAIFYGIELLFGHSFRGFEVEFYDSEPTSSDGWIQS